MKTLKRRLCLSLLILLTLASSTRAMNGTSVSVPDFRAANCTEFRRRLLNHTLLSFYDRKHSTNLAIAGISLFWTGLPAIPLGAAASFMGKRQSTPAVQELLLNGATKKNFKEINRLCAILLKTDPLENPSLEGKNTLALILGPLAMALAIFVFIMQAFYGVFAFWRARPIDVEEEEDNLIENTEDEVAKKIDNKMNNLHTEVDV